ncbi:hypothetical protein BJA5080_00789 [Bradyrhizobium diazoefficiens SEMIA 5080]|uniref:Uncharacterized protein n=2 Tax=Nitrobacteraceae TaxID=41294 RepID=A0A837CG68_9BRAD|nr:hypothetical protein BJA5080_00789 [Bradyrhizobium diazoefficiens SEMIA 5080]
MAATSLVAGYGRSFVEIASMLKYRLAFDVIALRYVDARRLSNRLGIGISASGVSGVRWRGARLAGVHVNPEEHLMTKVSKTLIFTAAFAVIATSAFSEAAWDLKAGMAYVYGGPGKMSAMAMAPAEKNHDVMMKHAKKVPDNTVFFMDNGTLYSASGRLDPTGNFYVN